MIPTKDRERRGNDAVGGKWRFNEANSIATTEVRGTRQRRARLNSGIDLDLLFGRNASPSKKRPQYTASSRTTFESFCRRSGRRFPPVGVVDLLSFFQRAE